LINSNQEVITMQQQAKVTFQNAHMSDLHIGEAARLNSGGPDALIIACNGNEVTIEWQDGVGKHECTLPRACVHAIRL